MIMVMWLANDDDDDSAVRIHYSDEQLATLMIQNAWRMHLDVLPELARAAVTNVLAKQRMKPIFGNVGAVNNLLERGKTVMMKRSTRTTNKNGDLISLATDMFKVVKPDSAHDALNDLVNAADIFIFTLMT